MDVLFVSDVHLAPNTTELNQLFLSFLSKVASKCNDLYILGDLFDVWVGDDITHPAFGEILFTLHHRALKGQSTYFLPGNRDFLIGKSFCDTYRIHPIPDPAPISIGSHTILLTHGDRYCIHDERYQAFRRRSRKRWLQKAFLTLPKWYRRKLAIKARLKSAKHKVSLDQSQFQIEPSVMAQDVEAHNANICLHGHIHQAGIYQHTGYAQLVLGDWSPKKGSVIQVHNQDVHLCEFSDSNGLTPIESLTLE